MNEPPTEITLSNTSVDENTEIGFVVGTFTTTDVDSDSFTYTLSDNSVPFIIDGDKLKTSGALDYETQTTYTIEVTSNDGTNDIVKNFTITVNDVNEPPTNLTLSNNSVNENVNNGTEIGTFTTTDPDSNNTCLLNTSPSPRDSDNASDQC